MHNAIEMLIIVKKQKFLIRCCNKRRTRTVF